MQKAKERKKVQKLPLGKMNGFKLLMETCKVFSFLLFLRLSSNSKISRLFPLALSFNPRFFSFARDLFSVSTLSKPSVFQSSRPLLAFSLPSRPFFCLSFSSFLSNSAAAPLSSFPRIFQPSFSFSLTLIQPSSKKPLSLCFFVSFFQSPSL